MKYQVTATDATSTLRTLAEEITWNEIYYVSCNFHFQLIFEDLFRSAVRIHDRELMV